MSSALASRPPWHATGNGLQSQHAALSYVSGDLRESAVICRFDREQGMYSPSSPPEQLAKSLIHGTEV